MPIRVKSRRLPTPDRALSPIAVHSDVQLPEIEHEDAFRDVVKKLSVYIADVVYMPSTFEQLRTTTAGDDLRNLVEHLTSRVTNPAIVNALLALRWHYGAINDGRGVTEARANACEIVAWRFLTRLQEREAVEFCLYEIPDDSEADDSSHTDEPADGGESNERTSLLRNTSRSSSPDSCSEYVHSGSSRRNKLFKSISRLTMSRHASNMEEVEEEEDPTAPFINLNALEIAAIADAKRFLSQHVVQKIITGIWNGEIIFWDQLSVHSEKKPRFYNPVTADPFSRLRVPKYLKAYEVAFFIVFLMLYYSVLIEQNRYAITPLEILLYVWFAAFFYDEVSEYIDAGSIFYAADIWNLFDMIMIGIGIVFATLRFVGLYKGDYTLVDIAFDVLSLEALFMVPRVCSILSLSPYWGTLIPCLKEMGKDFLKFMVLVVVVYVGFLTTFSLVGREMFTFPHMAMIVTKIFFGSSYVGFDIMEDIDPIFGPPLMLIFVTLSSILLMGSLTGMLSNSFSRVITHAREEYLYVYSVYVLEASTSNRLTHFYPPFNLIALGIFRPLRLFLPSDDKFRQGRIVLLRATHVPIVGVIQAYEWFTKKVNPDGFDNFRGPRTDSFHKRQPAPPVDRPDSRPRSGYRPRVPVSRQASAELINKPTARQQDPEDYVGDAPSDMEVRISELAAKIDRLTALVVSLQSGAGIDTVRT
ncbi:ion transporter [Jackrogersella minutella]|nr:ion transporter [Jackrogersella minutella]